MTITQLQIPDELQERFNRAFADADPSAVIARLMNEAIAQQERKRQSDAAVLRVLARRKTAPATSLEEILAIRDQLRAESATGNDPEIR